MKKQQKSHPEKTQKKHCEKNQKKHPLKNTKNQAPKKQKKTYGKNPPQTAACGLSPRAGCRGLNVFHYVAEPTTPESVFIKSETF